MSKPSKQNKKLRREVEILKAQLKTSPDVAVNSPSQKEISKKSESGKSAYIDVGDKYIKQDILKSIVISSVIFVAIFVIWMIQG